MASNRHCSLKLGVSSQEQGVQSIHFCYLLPRLWPATDTAPLNWGFLLRNKEYSLFISVISYLDYGQQQMGGFLLTALLNGGVSAQEQGVQSIQFLPRLWPATDTAPLNWGFLLRNKEYSLFISVISYLDYGQQQTLLP